MVFDINIPSVDKISNSSYGSIKKWDVVEIFHFLVSLVYLVFLVYLVYLVSLAYLVFLVYLAFLVY
jgi:hypothetical protein